MQYVCELNDSPTITFPSTHCLQLSAFRAKLYAPDATVLGKKERREGGESKRYLQLVLFLRTRQGIQLKTFFITELQNYYDYYLPSQTSFRANLIYMGSSKLQSYLTIFHLFRFCFLKTPALTQAKQIRFHDKILLQFQSLEANLFIKCHWGNAAHLLGKAWAFWATEGRKASSSPWGNVWAKNVHLLLFPSNSCSGYLEKHLIHRCLETWAIFFPDNNFTHSGKAFPPILNARCQEKEEIPEQSIWQRTSRWPKAAGLLDVKRILLLYKCRTTDFQKQTVSFYF